jgi:hypothetical protein
MRTIFRYPGGKSSRPIREWILSHRPAGVHAYREAFIGGGGVFFAAEGFRSYWFTPALSPSTNHSATGPRRSYAGVGPLLPRSLANR